MSRALNLELVSGARNLLKSADTHQKGRAARNTSYETPAERRVQRGGSHRCFLTLLEGAMTDGLWKNSSSWPSPLHRHASDVF